MNFKAITLEADYQLGRWVYRAWGRVLGRRRFLRIALADRPFGGI